jgi:PAS domain S-box-containing protein
MKKPLKMLIIEDSPEDAELLVREIKRGGFAPEWRRAVSALDLKAALSEKEWDIVVSDYRIPKLGGMAALEIFKQSGQDAPFILVSGKVGEEAAVEAMKAGAHDFILKDNLSRLLPVINRELREVELRKQHRMVMDELQRNERRYRYLFNSAAVSMWEEDFSAIKAALDKLKLQGITDFKGYFAQHPEFVQWAATAVQIVDVNDATLRMYGASSRKELLGSLDKLFTQETYQALPSLLLALAEEREQYEAESINRTLAGKTLHVMVRISIPRDPSAFSSMIVSIIDITERKKMEQALSSSKERFRTVTDQSLVGISVIQDGRFRYVNPKFAEMIGYTVEEMQGGEFGYDNFVVAEDIRMVNERIKQRIEGDIESIEYQFRAKKKNGEIIDLEVYGKRIDYGGKPAILGTALDVTERKRSAELLRASHEQLRNLSRHLEKVRELERQAISREIHDELGQGLTVLKYDAKWLDKRIGAKDEAIAAKLRDIGEIIDNTIKSVQRITSELRPRLLDELGLEAAIEWLVRDMLKRTAIVYNLKIETTLDGVSQTSATAIYRILQESLTNVVRHSEASRVTIRCMDEDGHIVLEVKDNGHGVTRKQLESPSSYGIMGMRERAGMCNGEVRFTGGRGTKVRVNIPRNCEEVS